MPDHSDRAHEIDRPRVYGNFRPSADERARTIIKPRIARYIERSDTHLAAVRQLPCLMCSLRPVQPHHLRHGPARSERAFGRKPSDYHTVPLCWMHHEDCHRTGSKYEWEWFDTRGIGAVNVAAALRSNSPNVPAMFRVVIAHKQGAIRTLSRRASVNCLMAHGLTRREAEEQYDAGLRR